MTLLLFKSDAKQLLVELNFLDGGDIYQKRFSGFSGFPDQPVPETQKCTSGADPEVTRPISRHLDRDRATSRCRDLHRHYSYLREILRTEYIQRPLLY